LAYLKEVFPKLNEKGITLGYDARHHSQRFAQLTATVFLNSNVPVWLFRQITPTPFVPYGILKYKTAAGVMVTASHNPKDDNGYKVYFDNGAQIISPHDKGIARKIEENLIPLDSSWNIDIVKNHPLHKDPYDEVHKSYFEDLKMHCFYREKNEKTDLKFTYTAMHGVGYEFSVESFKSFGLKPFIPVEKQIQPDPDFPTVVFPNPEEGKSALNLAIETANANDSTIILANDPDADRLAVAEKLPSGEWKIFNGNEIGAMLGWWIWHNFQINNDPSKVNYKDVYMLYSTVSSNILSSIAKNEGFSTEDTLTGFKWMGNRAVELISQGKTVLFAFEEAIGFMCGVRVLDKDGITAEAIVAEMAVYLHEVEKKTLNDQLNAIYDKYGFHVSNNSYYLCYQKEITEKMFHRLRHFKDLTSEEYTYPEYCGPYKIRSIRDLTVSRTIDFSKNGEVTTPTFPSSKSSEMLTFYFENNCILTIRTSGTEPKIKWYSEIIGDVSKSRNEVRAELDDLITHVVKEFYQPEIYGFKARSA